MALAGWTYSCPITINSSALSSLSGNITNQPVLLTYANMPASILTQCNSIGSDIRFGSDSTGSVLYPREIVRINKTLGSESLVIYVKIPSISKTVNTTFYMFWGNSSAGEPGSTDASYSNLVWSEYYGVCHFQSLPTTWKGVKDSSGNWNNMNVNSGSTVSVGTGHYVGSVAPKLSPTFAFDLNEYVKFYNGIAGTAFTNDFMFWANQNGTLANGAIATGFNSVKFGWFGNGQFGLDWGGAKNSSGSTTASGWYHIWMRNVNGTCNVYINGVLHTETTTVPNSAYDFKTLGIISTTSPTWYVSELRMTRGSNISVDSVLCMYINETSPSTFITTGTTVVTSTSYTLTLSGLKVGSEVRIFNSGTTNQLAGIESTTSENFTYNYSYTEDFKVDIVILSLNYLYIKYTGYTLTSASSTIPIQQQVDRSYKNPT